MKRYHLLILSFVILTLSACTSTTTGGVVDRSLTSSTDTSATNDGSTGFGSEAVDVTEAPAAPSGPVPGSRGDFIITVQDRVFFGFNSAELSAEAKDVLTSQIQWLERYPSALLTIEGHADERGTREYNLALSERRANAAREYLVENGLLGSRVRIIGYGKERPAVLGSTESVWSQNRRAVTVVEE